MATQVSKVGRKAWIYYTIITVLYISITNVLEAQHHRCCHLGIVPHHLSGRHRGARHGPAGGGGAAADATLAVAAAAHGAAHSVGVHRSC